MDGENEMEMQLRAEEERREIVAKYRLGRTESAQIDEWMEPKFEEYHKQDRYGFIHDQRLPDIKDRTERQLKQVEQERGRSLKWAEMVRDDKGSEYFSEKAKNREKMINRVFKGVPDSIRGRLWYILLDLSTIKKEQEGRYALMKDYALRHSPHIRQIDLDVNRTYRDHIMFKDRYNQRQQALFYVLSAYSVYNTEVGYCQGMSQIAALLLMYLNEEEDAFWALSQLMAKRKYAMHGFFIPGFPKLMRFQAHHDKVLKKFMPKLKKHMDKNGIDTSIYTLKWFFQCFLDRIPFSLALRVWDLYILEGESILTAMSYNILRMHRRYLKSLDMDRLIEHLQHSLGENFGYDDDYVITKLRDVMYELRSNRLASPGSPQQDELPQLPFGMIPNEIKLDPQQLGIRTGFSDKEREFSQHAIRRQTEVENGQSDEESEIIQDTFDGGKNGNVSFDPAGTSSPRRSKGSEAQERLDESVRMMLETADLNGGGDSVMNTSANSFSSASNSRRNNVNMDTSFESVGGLSQASNRSDVVRIRVPYNREDAVRAKQKDELSPKYDGNKIRISVKDDASLTSPGLILKDGSVPSEMSKSDILSSAGASVSVYRQEKFEQNSSRNVKRSSYQGDFQSSISKSEKHLEKKYSTTKSRHTEL